MRNLILKPGPSPQTALWWWSEDWSKYHHSRSKTQIGPHKDRLTRRPRTHTCDQFTLTQGVTLSHLTQSMTTVCEVCMLMCVCWCVSNGMIPHLLLVFALELICICLFVRTGACIAHVCVCVCACVCVCVPLMCVRTVSVFICDC